MPILCSISLSDDHRERHCPYLMFSANIDSEQFQEAEVIPPSSYASAAKTPCMPAPQIVLDPDPSLMRQEKHKEATTEKTKAKDKEKDKVKEKTRR